METRVRSRGKFLIVKQMLWIKHDNIDDQNIDQFWEHNGQVRPVGTADVVFYNSCENRESFEQTKNIQRTAEKQHRTSREQWEKPTNSSRQNIPRTPGKDIGRTDIVTYWKEKLMKLMTPNIIMMTSQMWFSIRTCLPQTGNKRDSSWSSWCLLALAHSVLLLLTRQHFGICIRTRIVVIFPFLYDLQ